MTAFKLTFQSKTVQNEVMKSQVQVDKVAHNIKTFLTQAPARTPANDEVLYTKQVFDTLLLESEEQQKMLHVEEGCRIKTTLHPARKQIVVKVWPCFSCDEADIDVTNHAFAQRYNIKSKVLFPNEELEAHPIFGSESKEWEMSVFSKHRMNRLAQCNATIKKDANEVCELEEFLK